MKAIKTLAMAALATAVFASCSNEDGLPQSNYPMDVSGSAFIPCIIQKKQ